MAGFKRLAERTGAAILIVRHMNKGQGGSALYRGSGSIGIVGAARAGLLVAPDPADDGRRIVAMTKSNLAKEPPAFAYRLVEDDLYGCARVVWDGTTNHTAADLLRPRVDEDQAPALAEAMRVLRESWPRGRCRPGTSSGSLRRPAWPSGHWTGPAKP
jgi:hypothetical protein